jgi:hypothetical protein
MFGLVVVLIAAAYFGLMFLTVRFAWRVGLSNGGTRRKAFGFASLGFLVVYLPVFWDHIPTLLVHRYQCSKDAGFTAFVDAKQWNAKNAEAVAAVNRLPLRQRAAFVRLPDSEDRFEQTIGFGGLHRTFSRHERVVPWLPVLRSEQRVADARTGQLLATAIDYSAGSSQSEYLRWWNNIDSCIERAPSVVGQPDRPTQPYSRFVSFKSDLRGNQP